MDKHHIKEDSPTQLPSGPLALYDAPGLLTERVLKVGITCVLFVLLFQHELERLVKTWGTANESHGILIPAFSLYFIYQVRDKLRTTKGRPSYSGLLLLLAAIVGYSASIIYGFGYPRPIMMIGSMGGVALLLGGWSIMRYLWLPILFLLFAIPIPGALNEAITMPLRMLASTISALLLNLMPGVECEASGVIISGMHTTIVNGIPNKVPVNLNVADACSGMRLLRTFVALGVAMAYMEHRPLWQRLTLLAGTVPIAIFCNVVRVLITGLLHIYAGEDYATGTMHTLLGMCMLALAFGLYGLMAWVMNNMFVDLEEEADDVLVVNPK